MNAARSVIPASPPWRLVLDFDRPGAWHMALDEVLLAAASGTGQPVLRLYSWAPPCISLGFAQAGADLDLPACRRAGLDVVRRPSGGRAVLHDNELTYSIVVPAGHHLAGGSVAATYRQLSWGVLGGLRALGVAATLASGPRRPWPATRRADCFATTARSEVCWDGRKLVGSAQVRRRGAVLQHGSVLLDRPRWSLAALLAMTAGSAGDHLVMPPATVAEASGQVRPPAAVAAIFAGGLAAALGVTLSSSDLSQQERDAAATLARTKYEHLDRAGGSTDARSRVLVT